MDLLRGGLGSDADQECEHAVAHALVRRAGRGATGAAVRLYRPNVPVVAFGRRDALRPGFPDAVRAARQAGFTPVLRSPGGRAVAYTQRSLVVDHIGVDTDSVQGLDQRFTTYADLWTGVLGEFGIDARMGEVPGEYCPGSYSVNARGQVKLVGTAQRIVRRAWLFSAVAVFDGADVLRPVLTEVYRHLGVAFDAVSVGSIRAEAPRASLDDLERAVIAAYDTRFGAVPASLDEQTLSEARDLAEDHRV